MKTRILSGLIMVPFLAFLWLGGIWLTALVILISFIGLREFYNGFQEMGIHPSYRIGYGALFVLYLINGYAGTEHMILFWLVLSVMASSIYLFNVKKVKAEDAMATLTGIIYIEFFFYHVVLIDQLEDGLRILIWLVIIAAFGADTCAYFTGFFLGKHKLCPDLSPKKTIEGAVGGAVGAALLSGLFGWFFCPKYLISTVIIGLLGGLISMAGDLTASAYKRHMGIKDYGTLIPGHGGIMDRFDSVLFTAPFVYYYIVIVIQHFGLTF